MVWEDHEHSWAWRPAFERLEKAGYNVVVFNYYSPDGLEQERQNLLKDADIYVVHSGSIDPPDMSAEISDIKSKYNIKVMLQTEAVNEMTRPLVDGIISVYDMNDFEELTDILSGK